MAPVLHRRTTPLHAQFFALGDQSLASSRARAWGLSAALVARGVEARCVVGPSVRGGLRALTPRRHDVIVVQKWAAPPAILSALRRRGTRLIFDVDDAIYRDTDRGGAIGARNRTRLLHSLSLFDGFTASTTTIANDLADLAPGIPTLVFAGPVEHHALSETAPRTGIVWLGSPATERYLVPWGPDLARLHKRHGVVAVGASEGALPEIETTTWTPEVETRVLAGASVGLFLQDTGDWEQRKSGYKVLEYIAHGVLPVAQRREASVELLGSDYPYFVDDDLESTVESALQLSTARRRELMAELRIRTQQFTPASVADRWRDFVDRLEGTR